MFRLPCVQWVFLLGTFTYHLFSGFSSYDIWTWSFFTIHSLGFLPRISEQDVSITMRSVCLPPGVSEWAVSLTMRSVRFPPRTPVWDVSLIMRSMGFIRYQLAIVPGYLNRRFHLPSVQPVGFPSRISDRNVTLTMCSAGFPPRISERDVSLSMRSVFFCPTVSERMFHLTCLHLVFLLGNLNRMLNLICVTWIFHLRYLNGMFHLSHVQWVSLDTWKWYFTYHAFNGCSSYELWMFVSLTMRY